MNFDLPALAAVAAILAAPRRPRTAQSVEEFYKGKTITLAIGFSRRRRLRPLRAGISRATWASTSRATRPSCRRTWPAPAACAPRTSSTRRRRRTAPRSAPSRAPPASIRCWRAARPSTAPSSPGSAASPTTSRTCVTWHTSKVKTWEDFLKKPITLGGQGPSSEPDIFANLYKNVFGAPIKLVAGYPGTNEITLAMERGEVDGLCGLSWSTIKTRHAAMAEGQEDQPPGAGGVQEGAGDRRRAAGDGPDQGHREAADPQADPGGAGDGAAVRGAARHSGATARPR